jgi:minor extracellular serine protease Vpr
VLVYTNGDGIAEQELAGVSSMGIEGMENFQFASVLLNAEKARAIRAAYEQGLSEGREDALDYTPAALATLPMAPFNNSTLAVIEAPLELVARGADGMIRVQAAALYQYGDNVEGDDYLGTDDSQWLAIAPIPLMHPYYGMEEFTTVPTGGASISLQRGTTPGKLILYYPLNVISESEPGSQFQVLD